MKPKTTVVMRNIIQQIRANFPFVIYRILEKNHCLPPP